MPRPKIAKPCKLCGELLTCNEAKHAADSCGAKLRSYARNHGPGFYRLCPEVKGWKTDHEGQGKCKRHGGLTPSKHGLYSSINRPRLQKIIREIEESGADPFDLVPEINYLKAVTKDFGERYDAMCDALLAWNQSEEMEANAEKRPPKPQRIPEFEAVSILLERISRVVERAAKVRDNSPLTIERVSKSYEGMAHIVAKVCGDAGRHDLAEKIQELWLRVPVG